MSVLSAYAPKFGRKRGDHDHDIEDMNDRVPDFLTRQDGGPSSFPRALDEVGAEISRLAATVKREAPVTNLPAVQHRDAVDPLDGVKYLLPCVPLLEMLEFVEGIMAQPSYKGDDPLSVAKAMCTFSKAELAKSAKQEDEA